MPGDHNTFRLLPLFYFAQLKTMDALILALPDFEKHTILDPPPRVTPNFTNPVSRVHLVYISTGICIPLVLFFATLRFYAKLKIMKAKVWSDCESVQHEVDDFSTDE
jgi:hypothetical protein